MKQKQTHKKPKKNIPPCHTGLISLKPSGLNGWTLIRYEVFGIKIWGDLSNFFRQLLTKSDYSKYDANKAYLTPNAGRGGVSMPIRRHTTRSMLQSLSTLHTRKAYAHKDSSSNRAMFREDPRQIWNTQNKILEATLGSLRWVDFQINPNSFCGFKYVRV